MSRDQYFDNIFCDDMFQVQFPLYVFRDKKKRTQKWITFLMLT